MRKLISILLALLMLLSVAPISVFAADEKVSQANLVTDELIRVGAETPVFETNEGVTATDFDWYKSPNYSESLANYERCDTDIFEEGYNYALKCLVKPSWKYVFSSGIEIKLITANGEYSPAKKEVYEESDQRLNDGYYVTFFIKQNDFGHFNVDTWDELRAALEADGEKNIRVSGNINGSAGLGSKGFEQIEVKGTKSLDLSGYKINFTDNSNVDKNNESTVSSLKNMFRIGEGTSLTIDDSVGSGSIAFAGYMMDAYMREIFLWDKNNYEDYALRNIFEVQGGKLTINGGSFYAGNSKKQYLQDIKKNAYQIVTGTPVAVAYGEAIINGGNFYGHSATESGLGFSNALYINDNDNAKAIVNSGYFCLRGLGRVVNGSPEIYSGTFVNEGYDNIRAVQTSALSNKCHSGMNSRFGIPDSSWKDSRVDVYLGSVKVTDTSSLDLYNHKGEKVIFKRQSLSGGISFTSGITVGTPVTIYLSGQLADIYESDPSSVKFNWMTSAYGQGRWITEQTGGKTFTPTAELNGRQLCVTASVEGFDGFISSSVVQILKQSQDYGAPPVKPELNVDYDNAKITVANYTSTQEYVITESSATPDWKNAKAINSDGSFTSLAKEKSYYVHTRYKETDEKKAGSKVLYTLAELKETVYLTGVELEAQKIYVSSGELVRITAKPIPENATNFQGILGSNWIVNSGMETTSILYGTLRKLPINEMSYYKNVYLYGSEAESTTVSVEMIIGYNNIIRDSIVIERADSQGRYKFSDSEITYRPALSGSSNIRLTGGTSAIVSLVNNKEYGDKPISTIGWSKYNGDTLNGLSFERIGNTNQVIVRASENCSYGLERLNCIVNGTTMINKLVVEFVEEEKPAESISLDVNAVYMSPGESKILNAKVLPIGTTDAVRWLTSNSAVATVSGGVITAKSEGVAVITAKAGDYATVCKVTVGNKKETFGIDVTFGTASAETAVKGQQVTVTADAAPENCAFDKWIADGISLSSPGSSTVKFTMPENDVSLTATYKVVTLGKPAEIKAIQNTNAIKLTWSPVAGAEGYRVFLKTGSGWKNLGTVKNTTATLTKLSVGTKYTYAVQAGWIKDGKVQWSSVYSVIDTATQTVAPSKIAAAQNTSAIKLAWTKCPGATGYRIYYYSGGQWKKALNSTTGTSHIFDKLKPGAKYHFAVRPYIINGSNVIWSSYTEFITCTKPAIPASKVSSPAKGKINLTWSAVNGADGYQVYYSLNGGSYQLYKTYGSVKSLSFSNLKSGAKYTFAVRAGIKTSGGNVFGGYSPVTVTVK